MTGGSNKLTIAIVLSYILNSGDLYMLKKILIPLGIAAGLLVVGFLVYPQVASRLNSGQNQATYQTEAARLGSLTGYVGATGTVRANQSATVAWQASGQVANVRVVKGDQVEAGAVLSDLKQTSLSQNLINAQAELINAKKALRDAQDNSQARANAQLALVQAQQALEDAQKESRSSLYQRASQETIDIARANLITANEALDNAESIYNMNTGAGEDSPVYAASLTQLARARQDQQRAQYNLDYAMGLPDALSVEEVNAKLEQAQAKLLAAKQEWERVKDGPDPDDVAVAQARVDAAQATLDSAHIEAPFAGTITLVNAQQGDLVNAGTPAFEIDDLTRLLVDIQVSEVDINRVQIDQPVTLTFDAIQGVEYTGRVDDIASTGSSTSGAVNFTVTVELLDFDEQVRPGMTAAANIAVSQLDSVLLVPSRAVRTQNGKRMVYLLENNQLVPVEITLGASSNNYSQVTSGSLKEGDLVVVNPPANLTMGPGSGTGQVMRGQ